MAKISKRILQSQTSQQRKVVKGTVEQYQEKKKKVVWAYPKLEFNLRNQFQTNLGEDFNKRNNSK